MTSSRQLSLIDSGPEAPPGFDIYGSFLEHSVASAMMASIKSESSWQQITLTMYGRRVQMPRLTAWYGDPDATYRYSGVVNEPRPWTPTLSTLRELVRRRTGEDYNSVLANYYRTGEDHLSWHCDDEPELGLAPTIASVSFGTSRRFAVRSKSKSPRVTHEILLAHGSLLVMSGKSQLDWEHCVRKEPRLRSERLNLTFRKVHVSAPSTGG